MKQFSFFTLLIGVLLSCNTGPGNSKNDRSEALPFIYNDSVKIAFSEAGNGDTTLLFIHGWDIDKSYWQDQVEFFKDRYKLVTVDLPGFSQSGKSRENWTVENYGKDISTIIDSLKLNNVLLIGHSMSGAIAVEAALQKPGKVIGVVGVDNFTNVGYVPSAEELQAYAKTYDSLRNNYTAAVTAYANQYLFSPSTDSAVKLRVINSFTQVDSSIVVTILQENDMYPLTQKLKELHKPLFLINSNWHPTDTVGLSKNNIPFKLFYIGPTGHYPMIEKPAEFNKLLWQVVRSL